MKLIDIIKNQAAFVERSGVTVKESELGVAINMPGSSGVFLQENHADMWKDDFDSLTNNPDLADVDVDTLRLYLAHRYLVLL